MYIVKKAVRDYCKKQNRRVSKAFIQLLEIKVNDTINYYLRMNSKRTLRP